MVKVRDSSLQQVFNADVVELAENSEVDFIFIIDSIDELT
jgi:hypothetical protein